MIVFEVCTPYSTNLPLFIFYTKLRKREAAWKGKKWKQEIWLHSHLKLPTSSILLAYILKERSHIPLSEHLPWTSGNCNPQDVVKGTKCRHNGVKLCRCKILKIYWYFIKNWVKPFKNFLLMLTPFKLFSMPPSIQCPPQPPHATTTKYKSKSGWICW